MVAGFVFALITITFIDLENLFIPDEISIPTLIIGIAGAYMLPQQSVETALIGCLVGGGFMLLIFGVGWLVYRREAMGLGDVKLMAMIGAFLGWRGFAIRAFCELGSSTSRRRDGAPLYENDGTT